MTLTRARPAATLIAMGFATASAVVATAAAAQIGPHFVHGSWVNVREAPDAAARVLGQVVTNTPVTVQARVGSWCQLGGSAVNNGSTAIPATIGKPGYVACAFLGPEPLSLVQASKAPARAFWIAPSPNRLAAYGLSLTPPAALSLAALKKTLQAGEVVHYPAVPEFDAAKALMKAGVLLNPAFDLDARAPVDLTAWLRPYRLKATAVRPSLFRTHESVALVSEADADGLAAVAGSRVSLTPAGFPTGWYARHEGPEIEGVTGFWDVGRALLGFAPRLVIYSVAANGLVGAAAVRTVPFELSAGEGRSCGAQYQGKGFPDAAQLLAASPKFMNSSPLPSYPVLKESAEVLVSLALREPLARRSVKIRTQSQPVLLASPPEGLMSQAQRLALKPQAILREIDLDLDGDGVADVAQLETPVSYGGISIDLVLHRSWFLNINGQWFRAGDWEDEDCT